MKYAAILLLAFVAVSQAAFTANLVQRAQPALAQAMFKVRLAASANRADGDLQTDLVANLQQHAQDLLNQVQSLVESGQEIAGNVVDELQSTYAQLSALGSNILNNGQSILSNLFGNVWSHLFGNKPKSAIGNAFNFIQNFNVNTILQAVTDAATHLANQLNLPQMLTHALNAILPSNVASYVLSALGLNGANRGIFSDAWNAISDAGSAAWGHITDLASSIWNTATDSFTNVSNLALNFISEAHSNASTITSQAATQFLNFLRPYQQDLGTLWDQVVEQVGQITGQVTGN